MIYFFIHPHGNIGISLKRRTPLFPPGPLFLLFMPILSAELGRVLPSIAEWHIAGGGEASATNEASYQRLTPRRLHACLRHASDDIFLDEIETETETKIPTFVHNKR